MTTTDATTLDLVPCPDCGAPAEVLDRFALPSTAAPVEHAEVRCLMRHRFPLQVASPPSWTAQDAELRGG
jgi:hypothetical protein